MNILERILMLEKMIDLLVDDLAYTRKCDTAASKKHMKQNYAKNSVKILMREGKIK